MKRTGGAEGYLTALAADSFAVGAGHLTLGLQANRYDGPWVDIEENCSRRCSRGLLERGPRIPSNDARGTTITVDPVTGDPADRVNPLVAAHTGELGARAFVADRLSVSAALWRVDLDSELLFIGDAGNTEASRPSTRYGIEVPLYYRPTDRLTFDFEVALTESRFTEADPAGDEIPGSIDRVLAAGVTFEQPRGFFGSARLRYFGPRPLIEDGSVESDSSLILNAGLGWRGPAVEFRIDSLNLLDSDDDDITYFYASRLAGEPAEGVEDVNFHPIEPRTVRAHVSGRFQSRALLGLCRVPSACSDERQLVGDKR